MSAVLRLLWSYGARVRVDATGPRLVPEPGVSIGADVVQLAKDAKPEILAVATELPAAGRCAVCGDGTGHESAAAMCLDCILLEHERKEAGVVIEMVCRECGATYENTKKDLILAPAEYRRCQVCRAGSGRHIPTEQPLAGYDVSEGVAYAEQA